MDNDDSLYFNDQQFKVQNKDVAWLCHAIRNEGYLPGDMNAADNTVAWLNELLQLPGLFDLISTRKRSLHLTREIERLRDETVEDRKRPIQDLNEEIGTRVRKLNRLTLEAAYPRETPKFRYCLTALIRTEKGDSFLQEYETRQDFRQDMKEHRNDIQWGLLVRGDLGSVIDEYYSTMGDRDKIGPEQVEPHLMAAPEGLNPVEAALREAAMMYFKSNKRRRFILGNMNHINGSLQLSESIRFLFDEKGKPANLPPYEDIIAEREKIEVKIRWLEAISSEMRNALALIKEVEEGILEQTVETAGRV